MDLLIALLVFIVCLLVFRSRFYADTKQFLQKKFDHQKTKYISGTSTGNLRVNKTRNPYSFK